MTSDERQMQVWNVLCEMDGETVARLLTGWNGMQLLDDAFREYLQDEGYLEEDEEPECCEDCDGCPLEIWKQCPNQGDYTETDEESDV